MHQLEKSSIQINVAPSSSLGQPEPYTWRSMTHRELNYRK